jgi:hypothetical protein
LQEPIYSETSKKEFIRNPAMMSTSGDGTLGQRQDDGAVCLGVDGLVFDISNLSTGGPKTSSRRTLPVVGTKKERPSLKLYPSEGSVRLKAPSIRDIGLIFREMESLEVKNGPPGDSVFQKKAPFPVQRLDEHPVPEDFSTEKRDSNQKPSLKSAPSPEKAPPLTMPSPQLSRFLSPQEPRSNIPSIYSQYSKVAAKPQVREIEEENSGDARPGGDHSKDVNKKRSATKRIEIEVSPGVYLPMRGAEETEAAVRCGNVHQTTCACCESLLYCIKAAEFLYCPMCRIIGPATSFSLGCSDSVGGIGLGLTEDAMRDIMIKIQE